MAEKGIVTKGLRCDCFLMLRRYEDSHETVWAEGCYGKKKVIVYPAMWTKPVEENTIFVSDVYLKYAKPYALKTIVDSL